LKLSKTFEKNLDAFRGGKRYIINKGGTRSSKTYSILQLLFLIASWSKKSLVIHVVSHSTPHLKDGAITDFEHILKDANVDVESIRVQNPNTYKIQNSIIKFIGFDKAGKALGAARDILFVNEANEMKWSVVHQLFTRTKDQIFIDYNPAAEYWLNTEGVDKYEDAIVLHSTFLDNHDNITDSQINDLLKAKEKHDEEIKRDVNGYWYNYWRVYGLGLEGAISGSIFNNWKLGEFDDNLPFGYCIDFGYKDPFTCTKVAVDQKTMTIYVEQIIYKSELSPNDIIKLMNALGISKKAFIVADSADPTQIRGLAQEGFNIVPAKKEKVIIGIRDLQNYTIIICGESPDIEKEHRNYVWLDKRGEVPIDDWNHYFDPLRYFLKFAKQVIR